MKKIILIFILGFLAIWSNAQIAKVEIMATGLTCSMCSKAINKQLKTLTEVEKIDIDLNKNIFIVTLKTDNKLSPKTFKDKVEKAGFFIGSMVLSVNFDNQIIEDNKKIDNYIFIDSKTQTLNGLTKVKVLDKGYITTKEYKKLEKEYKKYQTYTKNNDTIFHLKAI
jgi:copper chaperone CopZ